MGQNTYEEVDIIEKAKNYGWRAMEGFHIYDTALHAKNGSFVLPLIEYQHSEGVSITGGYVYRGRQSPAMEGKYIFGDWAFKVFYMQKDDTGKWTKKDCRFEGKDNNTFNFRINSFGVDEAGEIDMVTQNKIGAIDPSGVIYKIAAQNQSIESN